MSRYLSDNELRIRELGAEIAALTARDAAALREYLIAKLGEDGSAGVLAPLLPNGPTPSLQAMMEIPND